MVSTDRRADRGRSHANHRRNPRADGAFFIVGVLGIGLCAALFAVSARADSSISGRVTGAAAPRVLWVSAFDGPNLRGADGWLTTVPTAADGRFELPLPDAIHSANLVVSAECDPRLLGCQRWLPRVEPVEAGTLGLRLEVPDEELAQRIWLGGAPTAGPGRLIGLAVLAVLALLGVILRRRASVVVAAVQAQRPARWLFAAPLAFTVIAMFRLGAEPLDLLEYSYFHEAVRPVSVTALLTDSISAELAHGPVMPLLLRAVSSASVDPFWLRLPSVVFGGAFVLVLGLVLNRALGFHAGLAGQALAALSPLAAYYARDATPYALSGLLAALAVALVELPRRDSLGRWAAFSAVHLLGFFTHYGFAFFSAAQGVALLATGWRTRPRLLSSAAFSYAAAGLAPVLLAPHFEAMLATSGLRFGLMAGAYPESPGLPAFVGRMLAVIAGAAGNYPLTIVLWLVPAGFGLVALRRRAPSLAAVGVACVVGTVVWLFFSYAMSNAYGGGRIYWAFRWARPLLVGFLAMTLLAVVLLWQRARLGLLAARVARIEEEAASTGTGER